MRMRYFYRIIRAQTGRVVRGFVGDNYAMHLLIGFSDALFDISHIAQNLAHHFVTWPPAFELNHQQAFFVFADSENVDKPITNGVLLATLLFVLIDIVLLSKFKL